MVKILVMLLKEILHILSKFSWTLTNFSYTLQIQNQNKVWDKTLKDAVGVTLLRSTAPKE